MASIMAWLGAHQVILAAFVVALIDLAMALVPSLESSGILHFILLQAQKLLGGEAPKAP